MPPVHNERMNRMGLPCDPPHGGSACKTGFAQDDSWESSANAANAAPRATVEEAESLVRLFVAQYNMLKLGTITFAPGRIQEDEEARRLFDKYYTEWNRDTAHISNLTKVLTHPAHFRIIALGKRVVPFILQSLENGEGPWLVALESIISDDSPVPLDHRNDARKMREDWLAWGRKHGYLESGERAIAPDSIAPAHPTFRLPQLPSVKNG
jgi:hypothetical protein